MWTTWLALAFAADDTITAHADAIAACEPPAVGCVMLAATASAMAVGAPTDGSDQRVMEVTIDVRDLKRLKRSDALVVRLAIPSSVLPPEPEPPPVKLPSIAALSAPWSTMNLPMEEGTVLHSDGSSMTVAYADYSAPRRAREFDAAIVSAGWQSTFQSDDGGMFSHTYSRNQETLTFSAMERAGRTTLSITRF